MTGDHTPGPWVAETGLPYNVVELGTGPDSYCWCSSVERGESIDYDQPRHDADARLIAAAPDLLAICQELVAMDVSDTDDDLVRYILLALQVRASYAITKATQP